MNTSTGHVHLGPAIRALRLAAGHSLREMARRIGVSPAYLSGVERETLATPTHERLRSMAAVLGVPARGLTELSDRISPDLIAFLEATPEAVRFLRTARSAGLEDTDFAELTSSLAADDELPARSGAGRATPVRPLGRLLAPGRTWCRMTAGSKESVLETLTRRALRGASGVDPDGAVGAVLAREAAASTGLGGGVAMSHAEVPGLRGTRLGVCTLSEPLEFEAIDGLPVWLVFLVLGDAVDRLGILARIAQLCVRPGLLEALEVTRTAKGLHRVLRRADARED